MSKFKVGDIVIATKKSIYPKFWEDFKRDSGYLQVGKVVAFHSQYHMITKPIVVETFNRTRYNFSKYDLIKVE